jgi:hypothetical protein
MMITSATQKMAEERLEKYSAEKERKRESRRVSRSCFTFQERPDPLPEDIYEGKFLGIEDFDGGKKEYGPGVKLLFEIVDGEYAGRRVSEICPKTFFKKSKLTRFAAGLAGHDLDEGEEFYFEEHIDRRGELAVTINGGGYNKIESFIALDSDEPHSALAEHLGNAGDMAMTSCGDADTNWDADPCEPEPWSEIYADADPFHPGDMGEDPADYEYTVAAGVISYIESQQKLRKAQLDEEGDDDE